MVSLWLSTDLCVNLGWQALYDFSCKLASILPFSYGYSSPCLAYKDIRDALGAGRKRHPGLDIALASHCRVDVNDKALGVYWLNFFGRALSGAIGGRNGLIKVSGPEVDVEILPGSELVIRLGPEPQLGARQQPPC